MKSRRLQGRPQQFPWKLARNKFQKTMIFCGIFHLLGCRLGRGVSVIALEFVSRIRQMLRLHEKPILLSPYFKQRMEDVRHKAKQVQATR